MFQYRELHYFNHFTSILIVSDDGVLLSLSYKKALKAVLLQYVVLTILWCNTPFDLCGHITLQNSEFQEMQR